MLYLLHGLSDNHSCWLRRTAVDRYAEEYGIAVVMPEVQRSFYCDMAHGPAYFTYIADELPQICQRLFRLSDKREDTFIAGNSMGGYGALKAALSRPEPGLRPLLAFRVLRMCAAGRFWIRRKAMRFMAGNCGTGMTCSIWRRKRPGSRTAVRGCI